MSGEEKVENYESDVDEENAVKDNDDKKQVKTISKKKQSFFVKFLKSIFSFIITLLVMTVIAGVILNYKYQINAFSFIGQVYKINTNVDMTAINSNAFTDADFESINGKISAESLIEESLLSGAIVFTDREIASYIDDKIQNGNGDNTYP